METAILMGSVWVNRRTGHRVKVHSTARDPETGMEVVSIYREGESGQTFVSYSRPIFLDTFRPLRPYNLPNEGEVWTRNWEQFRVIGSIDDEYVGLAPIRNETTDLANPILVRMEDFKSDFKLGVFKRPLPQFRGDKRPAVVPVWEEGGFPYVHATAFWCHRDQLNQFYKGTGLNPVGYLHVPLDWDRAEWVEYPK